MNSKKKALEETNFRVAPELLPKLNANTSKVYIHGHGIAGLHKFIFKIAPNTRTMVWAETVAAQLKELGLPGDFVDIRLLACGGADRADFEVPLGMQMKREMLTLGYKSVMVKAYRGKTQIGVTGHRVTRIDNRLIRRSLASEVF